MNSGEPTISPRLRFESRRNNENRGACKNWTEGCSQRLAAERTLLAWIRTGLALMGFGFVVARFGLFLQQLQAMQRVPVAHAYGLSLWFGTALIAVG